MNKHIKKTKRFAEDVRDYVTDPKNRKIVIAVGAGIMAASIIAMFTTRGGKAKP